MTYTLKIWYAATKDGEPQVHAGLDVSQVEQGAMAFLHDLLHLDGEGVYRITVEAEDPG